MSTPPDAAPVREGDIIAGKYRVERVLGSGGMGIVVAAVHLQLGTRVAIKFLLPSAFASTASSDRFLREARAAARIESDHVARVTDVATLESGAPYMVMEFLRGKDLAALLRSKGTLPVAEAVDYVLQASEAIAQAHAMGIVHRDLKPSNLFLADKADGSSVVKVLDFGISKAMPSGSGAITSGSITDTASSLGSPLYMSPEQVRSAKNVDQRTDLWSLGVVLHELLAGKPPFMATTMMALCVAIANDPPAPLCAARPEVPPGLEKVVLRCLAKDADKRYASIAELARGLEPFGAPSGKQRVERIVRLASLQAGDGQVSALASTVAAPEPGEGKAATGGPWGRTSGSVRRQRLPVVLGLVLAFGVVGGLVFRGRLAGRGTVAVSPGTSNATSTAPASPPSAPPPVLSAIAPLPPSATPNAADAAALVDTGGHPRGTPKPKPPAPPRDTTKTIRDGTETPE